MSEISQLFEDSEKKNFGSTGNTKRVDVVFPGNPDDTVTQLFVKEISSQQQLEILKFLNKSEISEKLLTFDGSRMVLSKLDGITFTEWINQLEPSEDAGDVLPKKKSNVRFNIEELKISGISDDDIVNNDEVRAVTVDTLSKSFFLLCVGIFHEDIKPDNIMVLSDSTVRIIDFGESKISNSRSSAKDKVFFEIYKHVADTLHLLSGVHSSFKKGYTSLTEKNDISLDFEFWDSLFEEFKKKELSELKNRPKYALSQIENKEKNPVAELLHSFDVPSEIIQDVCKQIVELLRKYH
jgi:serine/threonine protein kinase